VRVYPCWNHEPRHGTYGSVEVQDGWTPDGRRQMRMHDPEWLPVECGHLTPESDPACSGCKWRTEKRTTQTAS